MIKGSWRVNIWSLEAWEWRDDARFSILRQQSAGKVSDPIWFQDTKTSYYRSSLNSLIQSYLHSWTIFLTLGQWPFLLSHHTLSSFHTWRLFPLPPKPLTKVLNDWIQDHQKELLWPMKSPSKVRKVRNPEQIAPPSSSKAWKHFWDHSLQNSIT